MLVLTGQLNSFYLMIERSVLPKNQKQEIILSTKNYFLVTVPPLIWNGFVNIGKTNAILANCSTVPYSDNEIIRKSPFDNNIPYKW